MSKRTTSPLVKLGNKDLNMPLVELLVHERLPDPHADPAGQKPYLVIENANSTGGAPSEILFLQCSEETFSSIASIFRPLEETRPSRNKDRRRRRRELARNPLPQEK